MKHTPLLVAVLGLSLAADAAAFPQSNHPAMTDPSKATAQAPATFKAKFETTKGDVVFECTREWAPNGVDRFYNLVRIGFFDDVALFRAVPDFVVQWGIHGDPAVSAAWQQANIPPDPVKQSNTRGTLTYAMAQRPDTRSTQLFINYADNSSLDAKGFAPICRVAQGMDVADSFYQGYGEKVTGEQGAISMQGNAYLRAKYPKLDYIKTASIVGEERLPDRGSKPEVASSAGKTADTDANPDKADESSRVLPWVLGLLAVGVGWFVFSSSKKKKEEPAKPTKQPGTQKKKKKKQQQRKKRD